MEKKNDPEKVEGMTRALRNTLIDGGCVITLFPISEVEWGMSVAMSENTPTQVLEQLSDALIMGQFEFQGQSEDNE